MALVASSISGAAYALNSGEDRENSGTGFEFTRRKKWPQLLLQEMSGSALFCIKPIAPSSDDGPTTWKIMYASPSVGEMTDQKPSELEGHDFLDLIYSPDQLHLTQLFQQLLSPTGGDPPPLTHHRSSTSTETTSSSSGSQAPGAHGLNFTSPYNQTTTSITGTTFVRILTKDIAQKETVSPPNSSSESSAPSSSSGDNSPADADVPTVVWEVRAHATGIRDPGQGTDGTIIAPAGGGFRLNGSGTMAPDIGSNAQGAKGAQGEAESLKGKAIWLMGRRVGENQGEADSAGGQSGQTGQSGQSLDAFLELKLENEKLREELKELQLDLDEYEDFSTHASYADASPSKPTYNADSSSEEDQDSSISSSPSSSPEPSYQPPSARGSTSAAAAKAARPKEKAAGEPKEKKRKKEKKAPPVVTAKTEGGPVPAVAEGMHVCVTCGRTDSPEWRKGPLGPKTLCNACGLRWAKRNSTAPTRKDRKAAADKK